MIEALLVTAAYTETIPDVPDPASRWSKAQLAVSRNQIQATEREMEMVTELERLGTAWRTGKQPMVRPY